LSVEDLIKAAAEFRVAIMDQRAERLLAIVERHQQVACLLGLSRRRSGSGNREDGEREQMAPAYEAVKLYSAGRPPPPTTLWTFIRTDHVLGSNLLGSFALERPVRRE
jgi:hypothetical protein